ncbi:MAG: hypothetical protein ACOX7P_03320, partial [Oscillospiraceae bacterium]
AEVSGLVGANWLSNTVVLAGDVGILDGFTGDLTLPISREDAALLIYNALYAQMVSTSSDGVITPRTTTGYEWITNPDNGTSAAVPTTVALNLLSDKFGMTEVTGILESNEWTGEDPGYSRVGDRLFKVSTGLDLIAHKVTVYQKGGVTPLGYYNCFGDPVDVTPTVSAVRTTPFNNAVPAASLTTFLKANGLKSISAGADVYINYIKQDPTETAEHVPTTFATYLGSTTQPDNTKGEQLTLFDYDGDKEVDAALLVVTLVVKITAISASANTVTFSFVEPASGSDKIEKELIMGKTDLAVGDYILVTPIDVGTYLYYVEPATVVTGAVDSWGPTSAPNTYDHSFVVNGTTYTMTGPDIAVTTLDPSALSAGTVYDFILDANGYVAAYVPNTTNFSAYEISKVLAYYAAPAGPVGNPAYYAYIVFPDGTKGTYKVATYNGKNPSTVGGTALNDLIEDIGGTADVLDDADFNKAVDPANATAIGNALASSVDYGMVYAVVNADGTVAITDVTTFYNGTLTVKRDSFGANITKGTAKLDFAAEAVYANSATTFYYIGSAVSGATLTISPNDAVYTGIANAPSTIASGSPMNDEMVVAYYNQRGTNVAAAVYYGTTTAAAYKDLYYFSGDDNGYRQDAEAGSVYKVYMYVNGVAQEIETTSVPLKGFYDSYTLDQYGYYVFDEPIDADVPWNPLSNTKGAYTSAYLNSLFDNYLSFNFEDYGYVTDDTKVVVVDPLVAASYIIESVADIFAVKADTGKIVTASVSTTAAGGITAIYVERVSSPK